MQPTRWCDWSKPHDPPPTAGAVAAFCVGVLLGLLRSGEVDGVILFVLGTACMLSWVIGVCMGLADRAAWDDGPRDPLRGPRWMR